MVDLEDEEIPKNEDTTFMLMPAPCTAASGKSGVDESLVIFCVDTSGSMCVTTEVGAGPKNRIYIRNYPVHASTMFVFY